MSILLDAGPSLNFLAASQQDLLINIAARLQCTLNTPEAVDTEIRNKATRDQRFQRTPALSTWKKLVAAGRVQVLDDTVTGSPAFEAAIGRISGTPAKIRVRQSKDLGELMVIAHASVLVQAGMHVRILMDESNGRHKAAIEARWLIINGHSAGSLTVWSTQQVLKGAQQAGFIGSWEAVYDQLSPFDDGLPSR